MGKVIVIGSQKGGVGKTTTTLNLAYSLKEMGKKVLMVDFDSQANLTTCYGIEDTGALEYTIGHLMMALIEEELPEDFEDYIQNREGVDYIPSSIYLSVVDAKLRTEMGAERMLAEVLEPLKSRYDYILIDAFMGKVESEEAKEALNIADKLSNMILFHSRVRDNGMAMMKPWEA